MTLLLRLFLVTIVSLFVPNISHSGSIVNMERSIGKVQLGMSEKEFQKATGVKPGDCLGDCENDETYAEVDCIKSTDVCYGISDVEGLEIFFWKKKIYYIAAGFKIKPVETVKKSLSLRFGQPYRTLNEGAPGLFVIQWKNNRTEISVTYSVKTNRALSISFKDLLQITDGAGR